MVEIHEVDDNDDERHDDNQGHGFDERKSCVQAFHV